ncbi:unnamed protein product [Brassica rapa]|uniref:PIN domain-containing protein n=1 Tax=Brassica campestris TaxID=3711 RepID=A0A8D9GTJ5_BRACM|nr:unnamed protein product [Brassica rapa]
MIPPSLFVANICKDMDSRSCLSIQHKCFMVATCDRDLKRRMRKILRRCGCSLLSL